MAHTVMTVRADTLLRGDVLLDQDPEEGSPVIILVALTPIDRNVLVTFLGGKESTWRPGDKVRIRRGGQ